MTLYSPTPESQASYSYFPRLYPSLGATSGLKGNEVSSSHKPPFIQELNVVTPDLQGRKKPCETRRCAERAPTCRPALHSFTGQKGLSRQTRTSHSSTAEVTAPHACPGPCWPPSITKEESRTGHFQKQNARLARPTVKVCKANAM